ncbi:MAG: alkaline phosphatase family protein [Acidobacteriota bacterium]|nr:alkaline phosphatase family protein [Acidobacteriota bacterium]
MWTRYFMMALLVSSGTAAVAQTEGASEVRLVLQITVDQLRGDLPARVLDRLEPGGFRYLYRKGTRYANAHYEHANTETIVGHATLATGAYPADHGMVGNVWLDRGTGELTYNVEDARYPLLTAGAGVDQKTEIDPTQKAARSQGRSPMAMLVSTFSDELAISTAGKAKIFGVSVKDRGAISLAGHAGKAFWFSKSSGEFVTSRYYYEQYPQWLEAWNQEGRPRRYAGKTWELSRPAESYRSGTADDRAWETDFPGYGAVFPHAYGDAESKYFGTLLTLSPAGDELTRELAEAVLENEQLGQDEIPDFLSVSFSSTDYVGHLFGPASLEAEDNLFRLDQTLAGLLAFVDEKVGLDHTLIVLSADHGGPEVPGYLTSLGLQADYVQPDSWNREPGIAALKAKFGIAEELIATYFHPYVYLDLELLAKKGLEPAVVASAVAAEVAKLDGVSAAVSSYDLAAGRVPDTPQMRSVLNNYHPKRSGDIFVVFEPHRFVGDMDGLRVASMHGSPWAYDTFVPIFFAGPGIRPRVVHRKVAPTAIAGTLAAYLGIKAPSGAHGDLLVEVLED